MPVLSTKDDVLRLGWNGRISFDIWILKRNPSLISCYFSVSSGVEFFLKMC